MRLLTLELDAELVEPCAEILVGLGAGELSLQPATDERLTLFCELPSSSEEDMLDERLWPLAMIARACGLRPPQPDWRQSPPKDPRPIRLTPRIWLQPERALIADPAVIGLRLRPSAAFGSGVHPSTRLCLRMAEDHLPRDARLLDVGCGSGILVVAALMLQGFGAGNPPPPGRALACDVDPAAPPACDDCARQHGVEGGLDIKLGSVPEIRGEGPFDFVFVNIVPVVIAALFGQGLKSLLAPGGRMVLAGILQEAEAAMRQSVAAAGFTIETTRSAGDWRAFLVRRLEDGS